MTKLGFGLAAAAAALAAVLLTLAWLAWLEVDTPSGPAAGPPDPYSGAVADFRRQLHDGTR